MESLNETTNQAELDRQVEITILKREIEKLEKNIKRPLTWKAFLVFTLIGIFGGWMLSFITAQDDYYHERDARVMVYLDTNPSGHPTVILQKYRSTTKFQNSYNAIDSVKLARYSAEEIVQVTKKIKEDILHVEERLKSENRIFVSVVTGIGALAGIIYWLLLLGFMAFFGRSKITKNKLKLVEIGANELKQNLNAEDEKDFFTQLVQINFKYLDQYYLQTQEQADKSFWISAIASMVGFLLIIAGIILMYITSKTDPGYVATSAGVLSEFIAAVFFYLYNKTILQMSQYHQKLVITQNISLALKTADLLKESKERVLETLIDRLTMDVNMYLSNSQK